MSSLRPLALLALLLTAGCVTPMTARLESYQDFMLPEYPAVETVETAIGSIELELSDADLDQAPVLRAALMRAAPTVARWGRLEDPIRLIVARDHEELERITAHSNYPWLRAWARYRDLLLQSPKTFPVRPPTPEELNELLVHELTHCVMFQRAGTITNWKRKGIPLWFREGMATVTAGQAREFPALADLARFYKERPTLDPITASEELYRGDKAIVYGSAHHAFEFLLRRYGEPDVQQILDAMKGGMNFNDAFKAVVGISPNAFLQEFRRYVRWGGYKRPTRALPPPRPSGTGD